jgi:hypothetical protein
MYVAMVYVAMVCVAVVCVWQWWQLCVCGNGMCVAIVLI